MQSGKNRMNKEEFNDKHKISNENNTNIAEKQDDVKKLPDGAICCKNVNKTTNMVEAKELLNDKVTDIPEGTYSVSQLLSMDLNVSWIIDGILPTSGLMILSGLHGQGKSFMALDLAIKMTQKEPGLWLDKFNLQSGPVAYIDTENGLPLIKHRLELLGAKEDNNLKIIYRPSFDINDPGDCVRLTGELKKINPVLIIIDSLRRFYSGSENDSSNVSQVMHKIQNLHPAAKIVLHHTCKNGNGLRGSGDLSAVVDSHLQLTKTENNRSIFMHAKSRWGKAVDNFAVDWVEGVNSLKFTCSDIIESDEPCDKSEKIIQAIRDSNGTLSRSAIIKTTEISEKTVDRKLKILVEKGILLSEKNGKFMNYSITNNKGDIKE